MIRSDQFRVARWRFPFAHDVRTEPFPVKELAKDGDRILVGAVPVLAEVISLEELLQPSNPFHLHKEGPFYLKGA